MTTKGYAVSASVKCLCIEYNLLIVIFIKLVYNYMYVISNLLRGGVYETSNWNGSSDTAEYGTHGWCSCG
jgi:hypothetical protein